jgi:hydrogenase expression/formation protein HypC
MCLGIPGQLVEVVDAEQDLAKVDVNGVRRTISVRLIAGEGLSPGDWVLVHVGFALAKIDEAEAAETLTAMRRLGQPFLDELEAFDTTSIT